MSRIVIIGGHGKVALRLSRRLSERGDHVTAIIRNPDHSDDVRAAGAEPLVLDVEQADTAQLADALRGYDAVVWSAGAGGGNPPRTYAVDRDAAIRSMDAAKQAGVQRYIMVSYMGARTDHGVPPDQPFFHYAEAKAAADAYLRKTDLDWTILGPGKLTDDPASGKIAANDDMSSATRDTSRDNVAWVAEAVLNAPNTIGATINFIDGDTPIDDAVAQAKKD